MTALNHPQTKKWADFSSESSEDESDQLKQQVEAQNKSNFQSKKFKHKIYPQQRGDLQDSSAVRDQAYNYKEGTRFQHGRRDHYNKRSNQDNHDNRINQNKYQQRDGRYHQDNRKQWESKDTHDYFKDSYNQRGNRYIQDNTHYTDLIQGNEIQFQTQRIQQNNQRDKDQLNIFDRDQQFPNHLQVLRQKVEASNESSIKLKLLNSSAKEQQINESLRDQNINFLEWFILDDKKFAILVTDKQNALNLIQKKQLKLIINNQEVDVQLPQFETEHPQIFKFTNSKVIVKNTEDLNKNQKTQYGNGVQQNKYIDQIKPLVKIIQFDQPLQIQEPMDQMIPQQDHIKDSLERIFESPIEYSKQQDNHIIESKEYKQENKIDQYKNRYLGQEDIIREYTKPYYRKVQQKPKHEDRQPFVKKYVPKQYSNPKSSPRESLQDDKQEAISKEIYPPAKPKPNILVRQQKSQFSYNPYDILASTQDQTSD